MIKDKKFHLHYIQGEEYMMKKIFLNVAILLSVLLIIFAILPISLQHVHAQSARQGDLYYSRKNAPVIYGTSKIIIAKNAISKFDILDSRFRTFAKDFEDGDIDINCIYNNVNINTAGDYEIRYEAIDSHNNKSTLTVPVTVTEDTNKQVTVQRILYTLPNDWNFSGVGVMRCNTGDRQNLGIFVPKDKSFQIKILEGGKRDTRIDMYNNDIKTSYYRTLDPKNEYVTMKINICIFENNQYIFKSSDSVPFVRTKILERGEDIATTYKVELQYNTDDVQALKYFRQGDDENVFYQAWERDRDSYAVVENEVLTTLIPIIDQQKIKNSIFKTFENYLEYYKKVINRMDEIIGLERNPTNPVHQNFRAKYLFMANKHGVGLAAYYTDFIATNSTSLGSLLDMTWTGLHEMAHGYQGYLGRGTMHLGEVGNNILAHYIQIDKNIYKNTGDWLEKSQEDARNRNRLNNVNIFAKDGHSGYEKDKLYAIINLFDYFEGPTTYTKLFQYYRENVDTLNGKDALFTKQTPNQDIYARFFADVYDTNIVPYWNQWGLEVSDSIVGYVQKASKTVSMLADSAGNQWQTIKNAENLKLKYGLVTDEMLAKYGIVSNEIVTVHFTIEDISKIEGQVCTLQQSGVEKYTAIIQNGQAVFKKINVGSYYICGPSLNGYNSNIKFVTIQEAKSYGNTARIEYTKIAQVTPTPPKPVGPVTPQPPIDITPPKPVGPAIPQPPIDSGNNDNSINNGNVSNTVTENIKENNKKLNTKLFMFGSIIAICIVAGGVIVFVWKRFKR